jgi:hypothetical protein
MLQTSASSDGAGDANLKTTPTAPRRLRYHQCNTVLVTRFSPSTTHKQLSARIHGRSTTVTHALTPPFLTFASHSGPKRAYELTMEWTEQPNVRGARRRILSVFQGSPSHLLKRRTG